MYYSRQQLDCQGEEASTSTAYERLRDLRLRANNKAATLENGKSPARRRSRTRFAHEETHHHHHHHQHYQHLSRDIRSSNGAFLLDDLAKIHDFVNEILSTNANIDESSIYPRLKISLFSFRFCRIKKLDSQTIGMWEIGGDSMDSVIFFYFSFYFSLWMKFLSWSLF